MTAIKKYFLCVLMCNSLYLQAMKHDNIAQIEQSVQEVCNKIDENFLGITPNGWFIPFNWFIPFIGAVCSTIKSFNLSKETAACNLQIIASYIRSYSNKKAIFKALVKKHWLVHFLIQNLIQAKLNEFQNVTGFTIDALYKPDFSNDSADMETMIYTQASDYYFREAGIREPIYEIPNKNNDIHFTVLYGHTDDIDPNSLIMSSDGNYLKTKDYNKKSIIWDTKNGIKTNVKNKQINWSSGPNYGDFTCDQYRNYLAISIKNSGIATGEDHAPSSLEEMEMPGKLRVIVDHSKPAIVLYKRSQEISHLCQNAFHKSKDDLAGLTALLNSNSIKQIEGFPQKNLQKLIEERVSQLPQVINI
jgi:hypothetical protein